MRPPRLLRNPPWRDWLTMRELILDAGKLPEVDLHMHKETSTIPNCSTTTFIISFVLDLGITWMDCLTVTLILPPPPF
jgi:hypothetical protein